MLVLYTCRMVTIFGGRGNFGRYFTENIFTPAKVDVNVIDVQDDICIEKLRESEIVLFCTSYGVTKKLLSEMGHVLLPEQTVVDICSVKTGLHSAMKSCGASIASIHPLYSPKAIVSERTCIRCVVQGSPKIKPIDEHFDMIAMSVDEHDRMMAAAQAAVHFQNYVTARFLKQHRIVAETRLLSMVNSVIERQLQQDPRMMAEIQVHNPHTLTELRNVKCAFDELFSVIESGDVRAVEQHIRKTLT